MMHQILVLGVVVLAAFASARPSRTPLCKQIGRSGCSAELKQTGHVCGTDGKTYRNACLLEKKSCRFPSSKLAIDYYSKCTILQQPLEEPRQQAGATGGEETVIGVDPGADYGNEAGDNPDAPGEPTEAPGVGNSEAPAAPGGGSSSLSGSSSEEAGGTGGAGGAGGAGAGGAGAGTTMMPMGSSQAPLSPEAKVCPEKCPQPKLQDRVCGSDGNTYDSACLLQQYTCATNNTVSPIHLGSCNNTCGPECPLVYEPVCGTDDLTYMSRCDLVRTACLTADPTLQVAYNSECTGIALLKACPECEPIPEPICSSNNMTFRSQCEFDRFVCLFDVAGIEVAVNDSCPDAPLVCPNYCQQIQDPVCGSDGLTYPNVCELGLGNCHAKEIDPMAPEITFISYGSCPTATPDPCSPNAPECDLAEEPVCAQKDKEQVTYFNQCFFDKEVCFDPTIKFISVGKCGAQKPGTV